jgi:hypothetical protein
MQGFQDLASQQQQRFWVYTSKGVNNVCQTWSKPPGISFVHIIAVGGGGAGASGLGTNTGGNLSGGGGGGSGAVTNVFLPAYLVPDILHIAVGIGSAGGLPTTSTTTRNSGAGGTITYVGYYPNIGAGYTLCLANGGGAASTAGGGGAAGTAASTTSMPNAQIGLRNYYAGQAGGTGTNSVNTSNIAAIHRITGGVGGWGGGSNLGPTLVLVGDSSLQTYNAYFSNTDTSPGPGGIVDLLNFVFGSGLPARPSSVASAQASGNSYYGCGGPGGACGNPNSGAGGRGGDGFVIITCG